MSLTNNLKPQVDLPTWEWCRFAPAATTAVSCLTTPKVPGRYMYYQVSGTQYRYDTYSDSWQQLASCANTTPTIMATSQYSSAVGYYGRAIGSGGGNNTIEMAGLSGNALVGYKIRIIAGTGAGQERTITAVSAPIIADRGVTTTAATQSITDASTGIGLKQWKINQYANYQVRIDFGTGQKQMRKILYNGTNSVTWSDPGQLTVNPWASCLTSVTPSATAGVQSLYVIESHIVTVDTNWTVNPDSTSQFCVLSGGIWLVTQGTTSSPFFCLQYYDVLADVWYGKSTQAGLKTAVFLAASDLSVEVMTEVNGAVVSSTQATAGAARSLTNASASMTPMDYANMELRIVAGTGIGQVRTILSNTATVFNVTRDWDTAPDNTSYYEVWRDTGKLWLIGGGDAGMLQYCQDPDQWATGKIFDYGQCQTLAAKMAGQNPYAVASITRTATGIAVLNATPTAGGTGYNVDDILTITTGGSGGTARVLTVNPANGAVLTVALETCGTGYTTGSGKATTVSPAGGTSCTLDITTVDFTALVATTLSHNYKIGDSVVISGATGTGAASFNGTKTIIGVSSATNFSYALGGDPGAATATGTGTVSTTTLVDCTKNWAVNEHVGKIIQVSNNVLLATGGQARRIVSNTANTITWTLAMSASTPAVGTYRYVIEDIKPFGTERSVMGIVGGGTEGFATSGSTTTIVDTTKNWQTNYWSRTAQRYVRIVEGTGVGAEILITSNTSNTLNFAAQAFTVDTTTRYVIMDTFGTATAGSTTTLTDAQKNWGVNQWSGKRVRFLAGTSQGNEYIITSNTATALTFATGTAPDTSTAYAILGAAPKSYGVHLDMIVNSSDATLNSRYMYAFTGSGTSELSRYKVSSEHWELLSYFPLTETLTTGAMYCYDGADRIYVHLSTTAGLSGRLMYFDIIKGIVVPSSTIPYGHSTLVSGNRMEIMTTADGLKYLYIMRQSATEMWRTLLFW